MGWGGDVRGWVWGWYTGGVKNRSLAVLVLGFVALSLATPWARGQKDDRRQEGTAWQWRWDPATGRDLTNYPPAVEFDHQQMVLEINIADMGVAKFDGVLTLTSAAVGPARGTMTLNARESLTIGDVTVDGVKAAFVHKDELLTITLPKPAQPGVGVVTRVVYSAANTSREGAGLVWLTGQEGRADRTPQIFSQGQPNWNSFWFPCHDFPNDQLASSLIVTAPAGFTVISNGALEAKEEVPGKGVRWTWVQRKGHASYLVMLAVGKFDEVDVGGVDSKRPGLWMPVYGPVGKGEQLAKVFKNTPEMVLFYEGLFDEPYPWEKYAQVIVRGFNWGGMENTSATVLAEYAASGREGDHDDLIAHELVHQWMGDLISCKSWEHLWLNEGWATFGEWLWIEHKEGAGAYRKAVNDARRKLTVSAREVLPAGVPVVSKFYGEPDDTFTKAEDPYVRGGVVLHMLRQRLGAEVFWKGVRVYIDRFQGRSAETDDFRKVMEEVSGQSLERFFDQWLRRPGMPTVKVSRRFADEQITLTVRQVQEMDGQNPAWAFTLPIWLKFEDGSEKWVYVESDSRLAEMTIPSKQDVSKMRADPNAEVLAEIQTEP